jgi:hypothetical protein
MGLSPQLVDEFTFPEQHDMFLVLGRFFLYEQEKIQMEQRTINNEFSKKGMSKNSIIFLLNGFALKEKGLLTSLAAYISPDFFFSTLKISPKAPAPNFFMALKRPSNISWPSFSIID